MVAGKEVTPKDAQATARLRRYWTKGAGSVRLAWGTPGDY